MSIISTALSATGIKDYLYGAAIVALIGGFLWYNHHERAIGAAQVVASDQKAVAAQVERDAAVQSIAAVATNLASQTYEKAISTPVANAPVVRVCNNARSLGALPTTAPTQPGGPGQAVGGGPNASPAESGDIGPALIRIAVDADALATALQAENAALRAEMTNGH